MHVTHLQVPDLLGDRVIGHVPAVIRALRSRPTDLRAITDDQLPAPRGPWGQRAGGQQFAQESLHPLGAGGQALAHRLVTDRFAIARANAGNLPPRQIGNAIEQDQVQEVLGRLNHPRPLEGLTLARQLRALGRQLLSELRILASNLLKWHGSLLSSWDSRRETFCHFFQHFTSYLGAYAGPAPHPARCERGYTLHLPTAARAWSATAPSWRGLPLTYIFYRIRNGAPQPAITPGRQTLWRIDRVHGGHCHRLAVRVKL